MKLFMRFLILIVFCCCASVKEPKAAGRLLVMISIDQLIPEYLDPSHFTLPEGLGKIVQEGFQFTNADLNYAITVTAAGHATLATGTYPRTHGIVGNDWIDPRSRAWVYCVEDRDAKPVEGAGGNCSPQRLEVPALGDWLKQQNSQSKVFSMAGKDRSAVLMGGKKPDGVFWLDRDAGKWVTSSYYMNQLPPWAKVDAGYRKNDIFSLDESTFQLALRIVESERLGQRGVTDLLALGLSATDYVGHDFGPESSQMQDHLKRLDHAMGDFLKVLHNTMNPENLLLVLTADHGVHPAFGKRAGIRRIAMGGALRTAVAELNGKLRQEWNLPKDIVQATGDTLGNFVDYEMALQKGISQSIVEQKIREELLKVEAIEDIYFREEMIASSATSRPFLTLFHNSYSPKLSDSFWIRFCENCIEPKSDAATHGEPYRYDTHVPLVLWSPGQKAGHSTRPVYIVDVAPTLARLAGIPIPDFVEGKLLTEIVQ